MYRQFGNHTWQRALNEYLAGNEKAAFLALGHVLHLLEDTSVPDHTRDDTHAQLNGDPGSPLEDTSQAFTNTYKLTLAEDLKNDNIPLYQTLPAAFYDVAIYSNEHFVSEDTINNEDFSHPEINELADKSGYLYDEANGIYVAKDTQKRGKNKYTTNDLTFVMPSYRNHLFPKVTLSGVGVLRLFFAEVERFRQNPDLLPKVVPDNPKSFFEAFVESPASAIAGEFQRISATLTQDYLGAQATEFEKMGMSESLAKKAAVVTLIPNLIAPEGEKIMKVGKSVEKKTLDIKYSSPINKSNLFTPTTGTISTVSKLPSTRGATMALDTAVTKSKASNLNLSDGSKAITAAPAAKQKTTKIVAAKPTLPATPKSNTPPVNSKPPGSFVVSQDTLGATKSDWKILGGAALFVLGVAAMVAIVAYPTVSGPMFFSKLLPPNKGGKKK